MAVPCSIDRCAVGAPLPEGGRARARQHLVARSGRYQEGALVRRRAGGEEWNCLYDSLPPIHCVKVAIV